jgi:hypothetical protein
MAMQTMLGKFLKRSWSLRLVLGSAVFGLLLVLSQWVILHFASPSGDERHPIRVIMQRGPDVFLTTAQDLWGKRLQGLGLLIFVSSVITFAIQVIATKRNEDAT